MADLKAFVRARLPLEGLGAADEAQIVEEIAEHLGELRREMEQAGTSPAQIEEALAAELRDGRRTARALARLWRQPAPVPPPQTAAAWRGVLHDVRQAVRTLVRRPVFTVTAVGTLALAIGATTAVYTIVRAALLRPLPYAQPEQIVRVGPAVEGMADVSAVGYTTFVDWRREARSFSELALMRSWLPTLVASADPERLAGVRVTSNYFRMLGVRPALGRDFRDEEDTPSGRRVAIISEGLWRRSFNADPGAIGRSVQLDGVPFRIVGVLPADFEPLAERHLYAGGDIWAPLGYDTTLPSACRTCQHLRAIGRLRPGVSSGTARAEMDAIQARLRRQFPSDYRETPMAVPGLGDEVQAPARPILLVLLGAACLVLAIGCANLSGLLLVHVAARRREIAIRAALGASRRRLVRQLLIESGLIAVTAAALGAIVAVIIRDALVALAPPSIPRLDRAVMDWHVLAVAAAASLLSALAAGTLPALRAAAPDLLHVLQHGGRGVAGHGQRARRILVAGQLAVAIVLLTGAGLMLRTMAGLGSVRPGFDAEELLTFETAFVGPAYAQDARVESLTHDMLARIAKLPGVRGVATTSQFPLGGNMDEWGFHVEGRSTSPDEVPDAERYGVTPDYLRVMRIPLIGGRFFTTQDRRNGEQVVVVGETTARELWPGGDPLGARVKVGDPNGKDWWRVIGIAGDVRHHELDVPAPRSFYTVNSQFTDSYVVFVVRTAMPVEQMLPSVRQEVWSVARDVPVYRVATGREIVARATAPRRFATALLSIFAGVAVLAAAVGLFGVVAFAVAARTRELGVRLAFGASRMQIVRLIAGSAFKPVAAGAAVGLAASVIAAQGLRALLFEVHPADLPTYAAVCGLLLVVAAAAHVVPLRRALAVDPVVALREE